MSRLNARWITGTPAVLSVLVLFACALLSALGLLWFTIPKIDSLLNRLVQKYDTMLPEITIRNGHASIRDKQPFVIDIGEKDVALVIDTREGKENEALDHVKNAEVGAVLARDKIVIKNRGEIRIVPLADAPDVVVNAHNIQSVVDQYRPTVFTLGAALAVFYFFFMKSLQVLLLGLIPYFGARVYAAPLTYGEALKISTMAMIPPVLFDLFLYATGVRIPAAYVIYFVLYIGVLVLAVRNWGREPEPSVGSVAINP
jgi:hypothetical protein